MASNYVKHISYVVEPVANEGYAGFGVIEEVVTRRSGKQERSLVECVRMTPVLPKRGVAQRALADAVSIIDMNLQLMDIDQ